MSSRGMKEEDVIAIIKACTIPFANMGASLDRLCLEFNAMSERELQVCRRDRISQSVAKLAKAKGKPRRKKNAEKTKGIQSGYQIFVSEKSTKGLDLASQMKVLAPLWASMEAKEKDQYMKRAADIRCGNVEGSQSKQRVVRHEKSVSPRENEAGASASTLVKQEAAFVGDDESIKMLKELQEKQMKMCVAMESGRNGGGSAATNTATGVSSSGSGSGSDNALDDDDTSIHY